FFVYGARTTLAERIFDFFADTWPRTVRAMWRETLAAALVTVAGLAAAYFLVRSDPSFYFSFVPESLAGGRDPTASTEALRSTLYAGNETHAPLSVFAAFLFTHNAQISLFAFALGIAFCLPSILLIAYNGCSLGAMFAVFDSHGLGAPFAGWILVHGVTELFAIMLAGAAGIRIGWAVAFPGSLSRLQAAERAGREGGVAMLGVVIMLFVAGMLEGFARQLVVQDAPRYAIAAASALIWFSYFYIPRGRRP
ncbi:MAG: stage II sporulation protein M, partial [Vitreimonas sp.]